ncbi:MAG: hypothetical protein ACREAK_05635 [Nitrosarchaeum sp.]
MGLGKIFVSSLTLGISVSLAYLFSGNANEGRSFFVLDSITRAADPSIQTLLMIGSLVLAILSIVSMAKMFWQIYENRLKGMIVSLLGFMGSILCLSYQGNFQIIILGVGLWCIGIIILTSTKNIKAHSGKYIL